MRVAVGGTVLLVLVGCSAVWAQPSPADILKSTGVRGGLVVHIGCGDGKLTTELWTGDTFLVQGLDADSANVEKTRARIQSLGLGGKVSADVFDGENLPYADNMVNLVIRDASCEIRDEEILRVLAPGGVALLFNRQSQIANRKLTKPWPAEIDEWTHSLHGPDNNAVAQDSVVGPPQHFQWISEPRFSRSHDHLASVSAVVSARGRLFSIIDMGSIAFVAASPRWRLVAQDAFNGIKLWEREIPNWEYHLRDFRSGPADIARRLVAVGDRVYVTLGYGQPVVALDAATGETIRSYSGTEGTREILCANNTLLLALGESKKDWKALKAKEIVSQTNYSPPFENYTPPAHNMRVMAVNANTGECLWKNAQPDARELMPSTLATSAGRVYFQSADAVICLDRKTGELQWKAPRPLHRPRLAWSTPTLVVRDGVVFSADRRAAETDGEVLWIPSGGYHQYIQGEDVKGELIALNAETGERLWSGPAYESFNAPVDVLLTDGLLWTGRYAWGNDPGITEARDPRTGEVRRQRPSDMEFLPRIGHARCHRAKATSKYLVLGRRGVEFVDLKTGNMVANFWLRGTCQFGILPANGLLYLPPHSCACSVADMLKCGFMALAPEKSEDERQESRAGQRLERGPAFEETVKSGPLPLDSSWPTYRHDAGRSGATSASISHELQVAWQAKIGGRLTSPVVADGVLLVADTDSHRVDALDAATGRPIWSYPTGARVDSPPTIFQGRVLFGSADGRVYCLRLSDGEQIWTFHAASRDRRIVVNGQLESTWPVSGSVLVADGAAYFVAGRTSYLDGGMLFYKLDVATGRTLRELKLDMEKKKRDGGIASGGHLPDVLSSDGESVFLRDSRFNRNIESQKNNVPHLWSSVGFLDHNWWHRTYWQFGTSMRSGWGGWAKAGQQVPAGRLLVTDGTRIFGFGRNQYDTPGAHVGVDADGVWGPIGREQGRWTFYRLFGKALDLRPGKQARREPQSQAANKLEWERRIPVLCEAMLLADQTLFLAGPSDPVAEIPHEPGGVDPLAEAVETTTGGRLQALSAANGETLTELELKSPPVFDGMAAASGRLYLSTKNGEVLCLSPTKQLSNTQTSASPVGSF